MTGGGLHHRPAPPPDVVAAVSAAVEAVWPRPPTATGDGDRSDRQRQAWRFSGRWWSRPAMLRRERPWLA
ncbi:MAG: hypothetical protein ACRDY3_11500 [Acidimicrobiales bacterium]